MRRHSRGFTLIELVVALTLTTLLLSTVYAGFWIGIDSTQRVSSVINSNESDRTVTHFLRQQLRHVETRGLSDATRFEGGENSLRFSVRHFRGDPALYTLFFDAGQVTTNGLTVEIKSEESSHNISSYRFMLISDLESLEFRYFGSTSSAPVDPKWHRHWDSDKPPQLVRLSYHRGNDRGQILYLSVAGLDRITTNDVAPPAMVSDPRLQGLP